MRDSVSRRRFAIGAGSLALVGLSGCAEPSDEGEPPASPDEGPPEPGPVEDQDGAAEQTPGRGPAGGPGESNETVDDEEFGEDEDVANDTDGTGNETAADGDASG